jgi:uncharacterized SAM-binding protein YcdF (DUF218 family)
MFELAKIYLFLANPARLAYIALMIGVALLFTRRWRLGRALLVVLTVLSLVFTVLPAGNWLLAQLEYRFPRLQPLPDRIDGIILLGGEINQQLTLAHGQPVIGHGASRLLAFADLAQRYPQARLIFSGGSGQLLDQGVTEAQAMPIALRAIGLDPARVEFEGQSRNTYENAVFSKRVAAPKPGEIWLVVTSAFHVPRTIGTFRQSGFPVLPYAVDYSDLGVNWNISFDRGYGTLAIPLKEFAGLAAYRLLGWSNALFPAP